MDGDGDLDLLAANGEDNTVSVRLNDGRGSFATGCDPAVGRLPYSVAVGDVDGDGDLDLLTANWDSNTVSVRLNQAPLTVTSTGTLTICQGSSTTLTPSGAGPTYTITGGPASGTGPFVVTPAQTTTYTITSAQPPGACPSTVQVTVTVLPLPAADAITGPQSVCPTSTGLVYTIRNPQGTSYQWTVQGGTLVSGQGTATITVDWAGAGTGAVSARTTTSQGCTSPRLRCPS